MVIPLCRGFITLFRQSHEYFVFCLLFVVGVSGFGFVVFGHDFLLSRLMALGRKNKDSWESKCKSEVIILIFAFIYIYILVSNMSFVIMKVTKIQCNAENTGVIKW